VIDRDLNAFGPPDPADTASTALAKGVEAALKQLRADTDRVICEGTTEDFGDSANNQTRAD
jgi:hypothetical protein